jgi:uncharacterized metal-binding protein YceD (DUF177 family)
MNLTRVYNLNKLGPSGDEIALDADDAERAGLAKAADALDVPKFAARILLKKTGTNSFRIHYDLSAEIVQACVVTLEPLVARIVTDFDRDLHFTPNLRRAAGETEIVIAPGDDEAPEEIDSPHYDLAVPLLEEFLLAIDPYPRAPGVEFAPPDGMTDKPESPFAVLKGLKSGG